MNAPPDAQMMVALVCPTCSQFLDHSLEHALRCAGCARSYPVRAGVPRLIAAQPQGSDELTAAAFTWHGRQFADLSAEHERHFLDVVAPMVPVDFRGKAVLDAGCGTGRNALFAARYGARQVWAMDLGDVVLTTKQLTDGEPKVSVVQADILKPPFPKGSDMMGFDFIFSIGVVHHLADPGAG